MSQGYYNPNAPPDGAPPAMLGAYRLVEPIGRGAMGEVWRAEQMTPQGPVAAAVKRILPRFQSDPALRGRFAQEARINARLQHPNIVQVLGWGDQPEPYLALEYVEGTTVARVLKACAEKGQRIPPAAVAYMLSEAAKGLDFAHRKRDESGQPLGIVHRDVSPQNLLLSVDGAVKVSDFGIARAADNKFRTAAGMPVGKLSYMAPEQLTGQAVDHRADVFSLAVVLWETLLVRPLVPRNDPNAAMQVLCAGQFEAPCSVDPRLFPVFDQVVMSALAVNPAQRTATAGDLAAQLQMIVMALSPGFDAAELVRVLAPILPTVAWRHPGGSPRPASLQFAPGGGGPAQPPYAAEPEGETYAARPNPRPGTLPPPTAGGIGAVMPVGAAPGLGMAPLATPGAAALGVMPPTPSGLGALPPTPAGIGGLAPLGPLPPSPSSPSSLASLDAPPLRRDDDDRTGLPTLEPPKPPVDKNRRTYLVTGGIAFAMVAVAGIGIAVLTSGSRNRARPITDDSVVLTSDDSTQQVQQSTGAGGNARPAAAPTPPDYGQRAVEALNRVTPQVQGCLRAMRAQAVEVHGTVDFDNGTGRVSEVALAGAQGAALAPELVACMRGAIVVASFTPDPGVGNITRVGRVWRIQRGGGGGGSGRDPGAPGTGGGVTPRFPFGSR